MKKKLKKYLSNPQAGFTLLELLLVMAIIGILSSTALVNVSVARAKARDALRISQIAQLVRGLNVYYIYNDVYPCGDNNDNDVFNAGGGLAGSEDWSTSCCTDHHSDRHGFLNGYGDELDCDGVGSFPAPGNNTTAGCNIDIGPAGGLFTEGISSTNCPEDPINLSSQGLVYVYHVSHDRQQYVIATKLERGLLAMQNDGGLCSDLYETGTGLGALRPEPDFCSDY